MRLARSAFETLVARAVVTGIGMVITVIVARTLGPEGRGQFSAAMAFAAIGVQLGNLGLSSSNTYYASKHPAYLGTLLGNSLILSIAGGAVLAGGLCGIFFNWPGLAPVQGVVLFFALLWIPAGLGVLLTQNLVLGMQRVRAFNLIEIVKQGATLAAIGVVFVLGASGAESYLGASLLVMTIVLIGTARFVQASEFGKPNVSFGLAKSHAKYGLRAYFATLASYLVLRVDILMMQYMQGAEQTGFYSIAVTISDAIFLLPVAIGTVLFPRLSAMKDPLQKWRLAAKAVLATSMVMVIASIVLMSLVGWLVTLLFGEAYAPAKSAAIILIPAVGLLGVNTIFMNYFASLGMPIVTVISPLVATVVNIPANYVLIPRLGIDGAAWASLLSYSLMLCMSLVYAKYLQTQRTIGHD